LFVDDFHSAANLSVYLNWLFENQEYAVLNDIMLLFYQRHGVDKYGC
jgi:hypothetical protein